MAHLQLFKMNEAAGVIAHNERTSTQVINRKNENIDKDKTHLNYSLSQIHRKMPLKEYIRHFCKSNDINISNRKDLNVCASWVITLPDKIPLEQERQFFKETVNFLQNRYGYKNVLSATVHQDETKPHLHFEFIPIGFNEKNNKKTVSARRVCNKHDLQTFHKDLSIHISKKLGIKDPGIINGATVGGNLTIDELKLQSMENKICNYRTQYQTEYQQKRQQLNKLDNQISELTKIIDNLQKARQRQFDALCSEVGISYLGKKDENKSKSSNSELIR